MISTLGAVSLVPNKRGNKITKKKKKLQKERRRKEKIKKKGK